MSIQDDLKNWLRYLPNQLTAARIFAIPAMLLLFHFDTGFTNWLTALIFSMAALTDFFDGFLARKLGHTSRLGALLDPIADKLLVTAALVLLVAAKRLPSYVVVILLSRDVAINGLRLIAAEKHLDIPVSHWAKFKTALLDISIIGLFIGTDPFKFYGLAGTWIALILSVYSAYLYVLQFWQQNQVKSIPEHPL